MHSDEFIRSSNLFSRLDTSLQRATELNLYALWVLADIENNRRAAEISLALLELTERAAADPISHRSPGQSGKISPKHLDKLALAVNQVIEETGNHLRQLGILRDITPELTRAGGREREIEEMLATASVVLPRLAASCGMQQRLSSIAPARFGRRDNVVWPKFIEIDNLRCGRHAAGNAWSLLVRVLRGDALQRSKRRSFGR